jgi:hypothetical protein
MLFNDARLAIKNSSNTTLAAKPRLRATAGGTSSLVDAVSSAIESEKLVKKRGNLLLPLI